MFAWEISDRRSDEYAGWIVYGDTDVVACREAERQGASELFDDRERTVIDKGVVVRRAPEYDAFAPHGPDAARLLADGWVFPCCGRECQNMIADEPDLRDHADECPTHVNGECACETIVEGRRAWCSRACRESSRRVNAPKGVNVSEDT